MIKTIENEICIINYSDSLSELSELTIKILQKKIKEYMELFKIKINKKIQVNYFDNIEEFRNFIYELRGEKESLPDYATGTYDNGMVNAYINKEKQISKVHVASHELFHILYMDYVLKENNFERIIWYDEGMAQFMSGEKDYLNEEEKFIEFYKKEKEKTIQIPNMNDIKHGKNFVNDNYNGYNLSYLSIKYLYETLSNDEFEELIYNPNKVKIIGKNIIEKMFNYFDSKKIKYK